jgi:hypothetical protein
LAGNTAALFTADEDVLGGFSLPVSAGDVSSILAPFIRLCCLNDTSPLRGMSLNGIMTVLKSVHFNVGVLSRLAKAATAMF